MTRKLVTRYETSVVNSLFSASWGNKTVVRTLENIKNSFDFSINILVMDLIFMESKKKNQKMDIIVVLIRLG